MRVAFEGVHLGPIITTATQRPAGLVLRCPCCKVEHNLEPEALGLERSCSTAGCGLRLRVNPFFVVAAPAIDDVRQVIDPEEPRGPDDRSSRMKRSWARWSLRWTLWRLGRQFDVHIDRRELHPTVPRPRLPVIER